jgi:hypothetical protein
MLIEEGDEELAEIAREARRFLWRVLLLIVFFIGLMAVSIASAQTPVYRVDAEDVSVVLYMEPCALPEITNLKRRAVWTQNGKGTEGCWAVSPWQNIVMYFADRTVIAIPQQFFFKVQST